MFHKIGIYTLHNDELTKYRPLGVSDDSNIKTFCEIFPHYTRRRINQDRMIFGYFSVNSEPIFLKFCKGHFLFKS